MKGRVVLALVLVVAATLGFSVRQRVQADAADRQESAKVRHGQAEEANEALLRELPMLDGVRFASFQEVDGPPGGRGVQWWIVYETPSEAAAQAQLARHGEALSAWGVVPSKTGSGITARDGDRWVVVRASQFGVKKRWGLSITLNALDGARYPSS
jgi:hypothetical protein